MITDFSCVKENDTLIDYTGSTRKILKIDKIDLNGDLHCTTLHYDKNGKKRIFPHNSLFLKNMFGGGKYFWDFFKRPIKKLNREINYEFLKND